MKGTTKAWLTAAALVAVALIAFAAVMSAHGWDFKNIGKGNYETNTYEITEDFSNISIKSDTADIVLMPSDNGECWVSCFEARNTKHSVSVVDGALTVSVVDTRKWYEYINISFVTPSITVYLPESEYSSLLIEESTGDVDIPRDFVFESISVSVSTGDVKCCASATGAVKIKASTGDIDVSDISAGSLELSVSTGYVTASGITSDGDVTVSVSTGDARLTDVACRSVISSGSTGDITLKSVIASEKLLVERDTGDVKLIGSDAAEIYITTDTGSVKGSLLTDKVFIVRTDTGEIDVPKTITGGRCEITTDTGDIKITVD